MIIGILSVPRCVQNARLPTRGVGATGKKLEAGEESPNSSERGSGNQGVSQVGVKQRQPRWWSRPGEAALFGAEPGSLPKDSGKPQPDPRDPLWRGASSQILGRRFRQQKQRCALQPEFRAGGPAAPLARCRLPGLQTSPYLPGGVAQLETDGGAVHLDHSWGNTTGAQVSQGGPPARSGRRAADATLSPSSLGRPGGLCSGAPGPSATRQPPHPAPA